MANRHTLTLKYMDDSTPDTVLTDLLEYGTNYCHQINTPTRQGCTFGGWAVYWDGEYVLAWDADGYAINGNIWAGNGSSAVLVYDGDVVAYAQWSRQYVLTFHPDGGTVSPSSKIVTHNSAVGSLPTPTKDGGTFDGWYIGDTLITAETVWTYTEDMTAVPRWTRYFGTVVDYFGLASSALIPIASNSGEGKHHVAVAHSGKYEIGVNSSGRIWRNPSTTYVVVKDTTVAVQLGKAWAATKTAGYDLYGNWTNIMTVSGYMIVAVEIVTEVGKFPIVTVSAVANEGANAVNNFSVNANKFNVSVPVVARSKVQNLLNAISGGGNLQRVVLRALCDPVVVEEQLMPCASDIVNGRYELSADTIAVNGEAAPTMAAASGTNGGFALTEDPRTGGEADFIRYSIQARREMT